MKFIKENFDIPVDKVEKEKFLECYLPTLDKIIEIFPVGEFEDKKLASMDVQALIKNQLEDLFDNGYVEEEDVKPCIDLQRLIDRIKEEPSNFGNRIVKCVVVVEPEVEEVTESLNEAKSNGEDVNQFFIFEDAAYCFGIQNPEDSFEKFINQFENIEFEEDEIKTLKEKFAAGVEKSKETNKEVDEEIDETVVKEIVESLSSKEAAAADLREKYKDPKYKEIIDALIEIFKEHAPEQAEGIEKALEEKEEINEALDFIDAAEIRKQLDKYSGQYLTITFKGSEDWKHISDLLEEYNNGDEEEADLALDKLESIYGSEYKLLKALEVDEISEITAMDRGVVVTIKVDKDDLYHNCADLINNPSVNKNTIKILELDKPTTQDINTSSMTRDEMVDFIADYVWDLNDAEYRKFKDKIALNLGIVWDNLKEDPEEGVYPSFTDNGLRIIIDKIIKAKPVTESYNRFKGPDYKKYKSLKEGYLDNIKNSDYWQHQVDYQLEHFGRVGGGLIQDLDENGFYLNADNKVQLKTKNGSLNESAEEIKEEVEEIPAPPANPENSYIANALNDLISGELNTIKQYNDFLLSLDADDIKEKVDDSIRIVISDIVNEENLHIGQLQEVLKKFSPNAESIEDGKEEAKEQLEENTEEKE